MRAGRRASALRAAAFQYRYRLLGRDASSHFEEPLAILEALDVHEDRRRVRSAAEVIEILVEGDVGLVSDSHVDRHAHGAGTCLAHESEADVTRLRDDCQSACWHTRDADQVEA